MGAVIVTGATGFVGTAIMNRLRQQTGVRVTGVCNRETSFLSDDTQALGSLEAADFSKVLISKDVVIHVAALAHLRRGTGADLAAAYRRVNVQGTINLAEEALKSGVKRFVYISSAGVHGRVSSKPFNEADATSGHDEYTVSKLEAERALKGIFKDSKVELVIIRPPLVYGSQAKGTFASLMKLALKNVLLPFGMIHNKRSMIYVENLADFIIKCVDAPLAANQTFLVSDGYDVSLKEIIAAIRKAQGKSPLLLPVPAALFRVAGAITGKSAITDRLIGDFR